MPSSDEGPEGVGEEGNCPEQGLEERVDALIPASSSHHFRNQVRCHLLQRVLRAMREIGVMSRDSRAQAGTWRVHRDAVPETKRLPLSQRQSSL